MNDRLYADIHGQINEIGDPQILMQISRNIGNP